MANPDASLKVNLGCGGRWNAGWRNLDGGPWTRVLWLRSLPVPECLLPAPTRRYPRDLIRWDLRRVPLPFEERSAAVIFSQWVLEYLTVEEAVHTLTDCNRVLLPGGLIRLCQTDISAIVSSYLAEGDVAPTPEAVERARRFLASAAPDHTSLSGRLFRRGGVQQLFDRPTVEWMLMEAGFTDIRFWRLHEGQCPDLLELEHEWDPPLIRVEARKPGRTPVLEATTGVRRGQLLVPDEAGPV